MEAIEISEFLGAPRAVRKPMSLRLPAKTHEEIEAAMHALGDLGRYPSRHELLLACVQEGLKVIQARIETTTTRNQKEQ